jgi:Tfp pilus assembly protein PilF
MVYLLEILLVTACVASCNRDPNVRKQKYLESGIRYEKNGKTKEAAIQFSNALKVDHNFAEAHYELAKTYLAMGNIIVAYSELLKTVDLAPSNVDARIDTGEIQLAGGLPDQALEQAKAVLAIDTNNPNAYALLCGIAVQKGDRAEALTQIQKALKIDPNRAAFHTTLALLQESDPQGVTIAERELERAISLDARYERAHLILAAVLEKKGDRQAAEQEYLSATALGPRDLQAREALAGFYLRSGATDKAEATLKKATEDFAETDAGALVLSDYYIRSGQLDKAETEYAALAAKYPKSAAMKFAYGRVLVFQHKDEKAAVIAKELDKATPNSPHSQLLDASLLVNAGKDRDAFDLLQKAVKGSPDDPQLRIALGRISLQVRDEATAELNFRQALQIDPNSLDAVAGLAAIAGGGAKNDMSLLLQMAEKAISIDVNFPEAYYWRGTVEANRQQFANAEQDLQTALSKSRNPAPIYVQLGLLRLVQHKEADGKAMLEKALEVDPNSNAAIRILVQYDVAMKQPQRAIDRVKQQIAKEPRNAGFYDELGDLQMFTGDLAGAKLSGQSALQIDPGDERAVQLSAQAANGLGDKDGAIAIWRQWSVAHPKDANSISMVALLEEQKGAAQAAMADYKRALQIEPHQVIASNNLAYLMVDNGMNPDSALTLAQQARSDEMPKSSNTADTLAWVYFYKGRYSSARDLLEEAIKADKDNPSINYHLGMTYSKMGDKPKAILHLRKAENQKSDPKVAQTAATALGQL